MKVENYRGLRPWRKVCRNGGHEKTGPGRCPICRRASDKARCLSATPADCQKRSWTKWNTKPESKAKKAAWSAKRNSNPEQKVINAKQRREQRAGTNHVPKDPKAVAARLLSLAQAKATQANYGIIRVAYA